MLEMTAQLAKRSEKSTFSTLTDRSFNPPDSTLDRGFGEIGIPAVAAAVRYQGSAKNPAYAPCSNLWRHQWADVAA